jgi:two-component system, NarL family, sensor histidine kinase DevS
MEPPARPQPEERLRRLIEVGRALVSELDLEVVLERVLEAARELTGARYAALGVLAENGRELERFLTVGIDEETHRAIGDLPRGRGVLGVLISDPKPLRLDAVGSHPRSYGFPRGHPPMESFLGVPIVVRGEVFGNLYLTEQRDDRFGEEDEEAVVVLAGWAAIAIANARTYSVVESRREELERAVASLEATTEIARALAGQTDLDHVLELVVKRGRALTDARSMLVLLERGNELEIAALAGELDPALLGERIAIEGTVGGEVFRSGRSERLSDATTRLRFVLGKQTQARTGLFVPLQLRGRVLGVLAGFDRLRDGPEFSPRDEDLLTGFAASAAAAVANAQDVAAEGRRRSIAAAERERTRWARELHDETLQELAALKLLLSAARRTEDATERDSALEQAADRIDVAVRALRSLITDLRPAALDDYGLKSALEALAERAAQVNQLAVDLQVDLAHESGREATRLAPEVEDTLYRVVQESLANVVKHADAARAEVVIRERDGVVELIVRDEGRGFDLEQATSGFGLLGMRERVVLVDGELAVESEPAAGTLVRVSVPALRAERPSLTAISAGG